MARDDTVERWLRLRAWATSDPPTAFVIGDSIADGAEPSILEALPDWTIGFDADHRSRDELRGDRGRSPGGLRPDVVVLELGTNDADPVAFRENGVTLLDTLNHMPLVVWQTAHGPLENVPGVNIHIHGLVSQYPNAVVADWDSFVSDDELSPDGVHPAPGQRGSDGEPDRADPVAVAGGGRRRRCVIVRVTGRDRGRRRLKSGGRRPQPAGAGGLRGDVERVRRSPRARPHRGRPPWRPRTMSPPAIVSGVSDSSNNTHAATELTIGMHCVIKEPNQASTCRWDHASST